MDSLSAEEVHTPAHAHACEHTQHKGVECRFAMRRIYVFSHLRRRDESASASELARATRWRHHEFFVCVLVCVVLSIRTYVKPCARIHSIIVALSCLYPFGLEHNFHLVLNYVQRPFSFGCALNHALAHRSACCSTANTHSHTIYTFYNTKHKEWFRSPVHVQLCNVHFIAVPCEYNITNNAPTTTASLGARQLRWERIKKVPLAAIVCVCFAWGLPGVVSLHGFFSIDAHIYFNVL